MENRNWNEFRHLGSIETQLDKKSHVHYQEYLQPSLFVHINFTYTDNLALLNTYQQVLDLLGDSFQYHDTGKPIRQREKALGNFSALLLLKSPKFITADLQDVCATGKWAVGKSPAITGGVGCTEFSAQLYRAAVGMS